MSNITSNSLAAAVGASAKNVQFKPQAEVIPQKIVIVGTGNPSTEAGNQLNTPLLVTSPEEVGSKTGFGYMLHRLAVQAFKGSKGIETYMIQQAEAGGAAQSAGEIDFTGSTGVLAGTLALYIAGIRVAVTITDAMTIENIADAVVAAINADSDLPVTAAKVAVTFEVTITTKTAGVWGDDITLNVNLESTDVTPTGITIAFTQPTSGSGLPDIQDALDSLGTGDGANEEQFTVLIHGYGQDSTTLNAIRDYVGAGNTAIGLWDKVVHKPFVSLGGDNTTLTDFATLVALGNGRKTDRANGIIGVPDSPNHPSEIAALASGVIARIANENPAQNYLDQLLEGIYPGDKADRWTNEYNNRDTAVKAGISPTVVKSGAVYMQNVVTFYHPDDVPQTSNGYRSMRNIMILMNILDNIAANFEAEKWEGVSIVTDVTRVGDITARQKARDTDSVRDDLVSLVKSFYNLSWLYDDQFSIDSLKETGAIAVRTGGDGFDTILKVVLSGEGLIFDTITEFDTSIAVFL